MNCKPTLPCSPAGADVMLEGACSAADPNATLVYLAGGAAVTRVPCPASGGSVEIRVRPAFAMAPNCTYDDALATTVVGERRPCQP
jgi:hypothetical protein